MPTSFIPQIIFSLPNQGLMVTGKISGDEVNAGLSITIGNETGSIVRVEQHKGNPTVGLLISGIKLETIQEAIGQTIIIN